MTNWIECQYDGCRRSVAAKIHGSPIGCTRCKGWGHVFWYSIGRYDHTRLVEHHLFQPISIADSDSKWYMPGVSFD